MDNATTTGGSRHKGGAVSTEAAGWRRLFMSGPVPAPVIAPAAMIMGLGLIMLIFQPNFFAMGNLKAVLLDASIVGILAVGMTVVITTKGIDLSIGGILIFSSVVMSAVIKDFGAPAIVGMAAALVAGSMAGLVNGLMIEKVGIPAFIATLSSELVWRGIALLYAGGAVFYAFPEIIVWIGSGRILGQIPVPIVLMLGTFLVAHIVWTYRRYGLRVHSVGGDEESARRMGIDVGRYRIGAYTLMGALAGFAGIVMTGRLDAVVASGAVEILLLTIAAVLVGGTDLFGGRGSMIGSLLGAILLAMIFNAVILLGFDSFWQFIMAGIVILVTIAMHSTADKRRARRAAKAATKQRLAEEDVPVPAARPTASV
ncbi:ABC transporter permease [Georgenia daeguensis]|uniref:ABC transporter permease n=1 Tax=Georgenia daeguensis TaxID=908355 RepID=A0ABP8EYL3_9MICO